MVIFEKFLQIFFKKGRFKRIFTFWGKKSPNAENWPQRKTLNGKSLWEENI
jgi:hypothetical protein